MKPMRQYKARQFMQMGILEVAEREKRIKNVFEELILTCDITATILVITPTV